MHYINELDTEATTLYVRDFRTSITPTPTQKITLIVAGCYIVAIAILWCALDAFLGFCCAEFDGRSQFEGMCRI